MIRRPLLVLALVLAGASARAQPDEASQLDLQRRDREQEAVVLRAQAQQAAREVERLRARLVGLAREQAGDEGRVVGERARFESLNAQEQALAARMGANQGKLTRLLGALQLYSRNPPPALLVSPRSATDAVRAAILMRAIAPELERRAVALKSEAQTFQSVRRRTALAHEALFTTESELADRRAEMERLIAQKSALERRLNLDAEAAEREARSLAARVAGLGGLMRGLPSARTVQPPALDIGRLVRPVQGAVVRRFGEAAPNGGHSEGVSFGPPAGATVVSPSAGVVDYAGPLEGWGQVVVISLGGGWRVVVAGLEGVATGTGRSVAAGEPIGRMGQSRKPGPELYMELRRDGQPVDPGRRLDGG
jgi:septal ring factor EnvC (AmiA/AmiB activator)